MIFPALSAGYTFFLVTSDWSVTIFAGVVIITCISAIVSNFLDSRLEKLSVTHNDEFATLVIISLFVIALFIERGRYLSASETNVT